MTPDDLRLTSGGFQLSVTAPSVEVLWRVNAVCQLNAGDHRIGAEIVNTSIQNPLLFAV